jgi:hypothetical protein
MSRGAVLLRLGAFLLLAGGCSDDEQGAASTTSVAAPSTSVAVTTATVPADAAVVASVDGEMLSIDFTGHSIDRAMNYTVSSDTGIEGVGLVVGYLATEGGPGMFIPYRSDWTVEFPDGLVTGPGPDAFDVSGLAAGEYTACVVTMTESEPGLLCVNFTIE